MLKKILSLFWSTKVALVLLLLILLSSIVGVILPPAEGRGVVFSSLWFNALLILLMVNIVFCLFKRIKIFRLSQLGTTIFHFSLVLLFAGVVYDRLFFFEGALRLTEGETLSCSERSSYDRVNKGRFFDVSKLDDLGEIYFHKLHTPYFVEGIDREVAYEVAIGKGAQEGEKAIIYVTRPLKYMGFEFLRDKEGYSPLFVLRDRLGRVLSGAYVPLQSVRQEDGTYLYRSGTAAAPRSFDFPQEPGLPIVFHLQTTYYPDKGKKRYGDVLYQVWPYDPAKDIWRNPADREEKELFKGRAALGEMVRAGDYLLSMDEVRYWASMKVIYRPGMGIIFISFWLGLGGIALSTILKMIKSKSA